jgi:hypothetical protein
MASKRVSKPLSKGAIERARAKAARERYLLEKKRREAAKKGWETRKEPENLFDSMVRNLEKYRETGLKRYYSLFRNAKRFIFDIMTEHDAADVAHSAADLAGWDVSNAIRFAKLS